MKCAAASSGRARSIPKRLEGLSDGGYSRVGRIPLRQKFQVFIRDSRAWVESNSHAKETRKKGDLGGRAVRDPGPGIPAAAIARVRRLLHPAALSHRQPRQR